jgi:arginine decarboxylase
MPLHRPRRAPGAQRGARGHHLRLRTARSTASSRQRDVKRALEVHELVPRRSIYLGAFLVGAYQETLGDLHNLFGDTHVVHIRLDDAHGWWIEEIIKGDTASAVLGYMQYDPASSTRASRATASAPCATAASRWRRAGAQALLRV